MKKKNQKILTEKGDENEYSFENDLARLSLVVNKERLDNMMRKTEDDARKYATAGRVWHFCESVMADRKSGASRKRGILNDRTTRMAKLMAIAAATYKATGAKNNVHSHKGIYTKSRKTPANSKTKAKTKRKA